MQCALQIEPIQDSERILALQRNAQGYSLQVASYPPLAGAPDLMQGWAEWGLMLVFHAKILDFGSLTQLKCSCNGRNPSS